MIHLLAAITLAHPAPGITVLPTGDIAFVQPAAHTVWLVTPGQDPRPLAVGKDATDLSVPHDLWQFDDALVTASDRNGAVVTIAPDGNVSRLYPQDSWPNAKWPQDITVAAGGDPFILLPDKSIVAVTGKKGHHRIVRVRPNGELEDLCPNQEFENLHLSAFALAPDGALYFTELGTRIRKISPTGELSTVLDRGLAGARGLAVDKDGSLVIADSLARKILRLRAAKLQTIAGTGARASTDGLTSEAAFMEPTGVAIAHTGTIYVLDFPLDIAPTVREISPEGKVRTIATTTFP